MEPEELDFYTLRCYNTGEEEEELVNSIEIPASTANGEYQTTYEDLLPSRGTYECDMVTTGTDGLTSDPSNRVELAWEYSAPNAPTNLLIIVEQGTK